MTGLVDVDGFSLRVVGLPTTDYSRLQMKLSTNPYSHGFRIFLRGVGAGVPTSKVDVLTYYFGNLCTERCIKVKEFGLWRAMTRELIHIV